MGRHHNQVGFFRRAVCKIALTGSPLTNTHRMTRPCELGAERSIRILSSFAFLSLAKRRSEQIPPGELGAIQRARRRHGSALSRHGAYNLRMEMVGQSRCLMNHGQRGIREINRQKNLLNIQHRGRSASFCPESFQVLRPIRQPDCLFALDLFPDFFNHIGIGQGGDVSSVHVVGDALREHGA